MDSDDYRPNESFVTTRWTVVIDAARGGDVQSNQAFSKLCQDYWSPVYAFIRKQGNSAEDAKDLTQSFFVAILKSRSFRKADPERGKFRTYLLGNVKFFLSGAREKSAALKRGGGVVHLSMDVRELEEFLAPQLRDDLSPDKLYDRQWVRTVIDSVMEELKAEYAARGREALFTELRSRLLENSEGESYAIIAERNAMTEPSIRMAVMRMRERFRMLFKLRVAATVDSEDEVESEVRELLGAYR